MDRQHSDVGWSDAANAHGLAETAWRDFGELLPGFVSQADDARIIEAAWNEFIFHLAKPLDLLRLAMDVAFIARANFQEPADGRRDRKA